jgi:hypothetical protein
MKKNFLVSSAIYTAYINYAGFNFGLLASPIVYRISRTFIFAIYFLPFFDNHVDRLRCPPLSRSPLIQSLTKAKNWTQMEEKQFGNSVHTSIGGKSMTYTNRSFLKNTVCIKNDPSQSVPEVAVLNPN